MSRRDVCDVSGIARSNRRLLTAGENGKREFPTEASGTAGDQPRLHNFPRFGFRGERARRHDPSRRSLFSPRWHPPTPPSFVLSIKIEMRTQTPVACGTEKRKASHDCVIREPRHLSGMNPPCVDVATPAASSESISAVPTWRQPSDTERRRSRLRERASFGSAAARPRCLAAVCFRGQQRPTRDRRTNRFMRIPAEQP